MVTKMVKKFEFEKTVPCQMTSTVGLPMLLFVGNIKIQY